MKGVDTNILLRVFIDDEPLQTAAVRKMVATAKRGELLVSIIVMVEFIWTLRSHFKVQKSDLVETLRGLLASAVFEIEDRAEVETALNLYAGAKIDLADSLISQRNRRLGANVTYSFDTLAIDLALFTPLVV